MRSSGTASLNISARDRQPDRSQPHPIRGTTVTAPPGTTGHSANGFDVSVVVPVYKAGRFLHRCVTSVLAQPQVREVILVEDGSPDDSLEVGHPLAKAHPDRVRLVQHSDKGNHGAGASRNLGAENSTSRFLAFLDADDVYLPGRFMRDAEIFATHPAAAGVYTALGTRFEEEAGRDWYVKSGFPELTTMKQAVAPEELFFAMNPIGSLGRFSFDALTLRREAFLQTPRFGTLDIGEDTLLLVQMALLLRLYPGSIDRPVALRGVHAANRVQNIKALRAGTAALFRELEVWIETVPATPRHRHALWLAHLSKASSHGAVLAQLRTHPSLLLHPATLFTLLRWTLCRRYPDDPFLPGLRRSRFL